jgi:LacI family transcriptional regulator, repressor for deo operon, udp, cdd, tsx, nupC, and nupG
MALLLDTPHPPDAVFCYRDLVAIGAMYTPAVRGLRVPDDVVIVGYDGIEEGRYSKPDVDHDRAGQGGDREHRRRGLMARIEICHLDAAEVKNAHQSMVGESTTPPHGAVQRVFERGTVPCGAVRLVTRWWGRRGPGRRSRGCRRGAS